MKLYYSGISPFVRKVLITAHLKSLNNQIELINLSASGVFTPTTEFTNANPLSKVPTLITDDVGSDTEVIIDSPIICEYLNSLNELNNIYPLEKADYFRQKKYEAIADGVMDAAVLRQYETLRPEAQRSSEFDAKQKQKIDLGYKFFDDECKNNRLSKTQFYIGEISVVSMIGYLDYRFGHENWIDKSPYLKQWLESVQNHPVFKETAPKK